MKAIQNLENLIKAYDQMIEKKVEKNASDKLIGRLELKRQDIIQKLKKAKLVKAEKRECYHCKKEYSTRYNCSLFCSKNCLDKFEKAADPRVVFVYKYIIEELEEEIEDLNDRMCPRCESRA